MPTIISPPGSSVLTGKVVAVTYNGLSTGPEEPWHLVEIKGLDDMAALATGDVQLNGLDGMLFGEDREGKRVIELTLATVSTSLTLPAQLDEIENNIRQLVSAFQRRVDDTLPLDITYQDQHGNQYVRTIFCRPRKRTVPHKYDYPQTSAQVVVTLEAPDPHIYGPQQSGQCGMALGAGGRSYPRVYPYTYGTLGSGGTISVTNDGSRESYPVAYVFGPAVNPVVENVTQGKEIKVLLTLGVDDWLTLDFWERTIVLNGQASRYYALTGQSAWWSLDPGVSLVRLSGDFFQSAATLQLYWRSAS